MTARADHDDEDGQQRPAAAADLAGTALADLARDALACVPAASHVGITLASRDGQVHTAAATRGYPGVLDRIQQRYGEGPCLSAAWENRVVRIDDLARVQRWPAYCRDVVAQTPIRSVMAFQLFATRHDAGALNFFAELPYAFDDEAVQAGVLAATRTAMDWQMIRRDEQFRSALVSRDIIGQAKGMLMERFTIDPVQAFELLKRLSQGSNTKLIEIAHQLIERRFHDEHRG